MSPHFLNGGIIMKIMEVLYRIDEVKPNSYSQSEKVKWLSALDGIVKTEIIDTHEGGLEEAFKGYDVDTDLNKDLLIPFPYDDIYLRWLEMQIDYANGEYGKYNNSITMYNTAYSAYEKFYNRTHKPKAKRFTNF